MGIKEETQRVRDISILGLMGYPHDRKRLIKCPFHDDSTPSCWIKPNNFYICFGCGKKGKNFIDFCLDMGYSMKQIMDEYSI